MSRTIIFLFLGLTACAPEFDRYNELDDFRVMAVRSEPPWLEPDGTATLDALVFVDDGAPVRMEWSWCPVESDGDCALPYATLAAAVPGHDVPAYELGDGATATLPYPVPGEAARAVCESTGADCDEGIDIQVKLVATAHGRSITALKAVRLLFDAEGTTNQNPELTALAAIQDETRIELSPEGATPLARDDTYDLRLAAPEDSAEIVGSTRESLTITWFVEAGSTDWVRTGLFDGGGWDDALNNTYDTPDEGETVKLFCVVRDDRGGVGWLTRTVSLAR